VHEADTIVVETNQGGEMIRTTLRTVKPGIPVKEVHASRGKATRAEPISALYEQGLISHVGRFDTLEDQQCNWVPGMPSPDRMDAAVWALTALYNLIGEQSTGGFG
jgi:phage terminase large subunit-like protein